MWIAVDNILYNLDKISKIYVQERKENEYVIMVKIDGDYEQLGNSIYTKEQVDARIYKLKDFLLGESNGE